MPADPGTERLLAVVRAPLAPDEDLVEVFTASAPVPDGWDEVTTFLMLFPLIWAGRTLAWMLATRKAKRTSGVPLARRMIIAVTSRRLLIWAASRRWTPLALAGEIPREQVTAVTTYGPATATRGFVFHLSTGASITLRVGHQAAQDMTALFSASGGGQPS